jgi:hypothetical protein
VATGPYTVAELLTNDPIIEGSMADGAEAKREKIVKNRSI